MAGNVIQIVKDLVIKGDGTENTAVIDLRTWPLGDSFAGVIGPDSVTVIDPSSANNPTGSVYTKFLFGTLVASVTITWASNLPAGDQQIRIYANYNV